MRSPSSPLHLVSPAAASSRPRIRQSTIKTAILPVKCTPPSEARTNTDLFVSAGDCFQQAGRDGRWRSRGTSWAPTGETTCNADCSDAQNTTKGLKNKQLTLPQ